jgi:RNA polymerase sigma-70 factor (ECF subfamily)
MTMDNEELDRLAIAAQGGDREAFHRLYTETQREVRLSIAAQANSREQVDEILQSTYIAAFESLAQYRPTQTLRFWLKAIARNKLTDQWRAKRRFAECSGADMDAMLAVKVVNDLESEESTEAARARSDRLTQCLERLPGNARAMMERRYRDGQPPAALARQFHRTTEAINLILFRIRQGLRRCMQEGT